MADPAPTPPTLDEILHKRVVVTVPGMDAASARRDVVYTVRGPEPGHSAGQTPLHMDVYTPAPAAHAPGVVVIVHGGPVPRLGARNLGVFRSYGELLAASGIAAVTFDHRYLSPERLADACQDLEALLQHVRAEASRLGLDGERVALWVFSGGGPLLAAPLRRRPAWLVAAAAFYAALDSPVPEYSVAAALGDDARDAPPLLVARAGLDAPALNASIDRFVARALAAGATLDLLTHPAGRHGFDFLDDDPRSAAVVRHAVRWLQDRLAPAR